MRHANLRAQKRWRSESDQRCNNQYTHESEYP